MSGTRAARDSDPEGSFTIIIPTLQRSTLLTELVRRLSDSPLVHDVLVINNATTSWPFEHPKCRVLDMPRNTYVNPAWNLGVEQARTGLIGLVNDDVLFDPRILRPIARRLVRGAGIIGPATSCVRDVEDAPVRLRRRAFFVPAYERPFAFGTAMFMRRDDYAPVPDDLKVWRGDDYLFRRQVRRNFMVYGIDVRTHMSTTSGDPAFDAIKEADMTAFQQLYAEDPYRLRYWKEFRASRALRRTWQSIVRALRREGMKGG